MADLTAQQNQALTLLITGRSIPEIAQELGLHRSTVWRWSREPAFEAESHEYFSVGIRNSFLQYLK